MSDYEDWRRKHLAMLAQRESEARVARTASVDQWKVGTAEGIADANRRVLWVGDFVHEFYVRKNVDVVRHLPPSFHDSPWRELGFYPGSVYGEGNQPEDFRAFIEAEAAWARLPDFQLTRVYSDENFVEILLVLSYASGPRSSPDKHMVDYPTFVRARTTFTWAGPEGQKRIREGQLVFGTTLHGVQWWKWVTPEEAWTTPADTWAEQAEATRALLTSLAPSSPVETPMPPQGPPTHSEPVSQHWAHGPGQEDPAPAQEEYDDW